MFSTFLSVSIPSKRIYNIITSNAVIRDCDLPALFCNFWSLSDRYLPTRPETSLQHLKYHDTNIAYIFNNIRRGTKSRIRLRSRRPAETFLHIISTCACQFNDSSISIPKYFVRVHSIYWMIIDVYNGIMIYILFWQAITMSLVFFAFTVSLFACIPSWALFRALLSCISSW